MFDLADAVIASASSLVTDKESKLESIYGIYHYAGSPECSWYDFAEYILNQGAIAKKLPHNFKLQKIKSSEFKTAAKRPQYSALDSFARNRWFL